MLTWTTDAILTTHKCNETDKNLLFNNFDYIDGVTMDFSWSKMYCLDNPEMINMRHGNSKHKK